MAAKTTRTRGRTLLPPGPAATCAEGLKALAHPLRLRLVDLLCAGEHSVGEMSRLLGADQAIVSQQLKILRLNGLAASDRSGGSSRYRLANEHLPDLIDCVRRCNRLEGTEAGRRGRGR